MSDISPFAHYLKTNDGPAVEEVKPIEVYIKDQVEIAKSIADKLHELDKARDLLQAQLDERNQTIEQHRAILSSIRRFPDDVVSSVFEAALAQEGFPSITISHVCHGWRSLAIRTPSLWTRVSVKVDPHGHPQLAAESVDMLPEEDLAAHTRKVELWKHGLREKYERVAEYIRRSGKCALSISFETSEFRNSPYNAEIQKLYSQLIEVLIPTSPRWEYVDFDIQANALDSVLIRLFQIPPSDVANVKTLRLKVECHGDSAWLAKWGGMGGEAPLTGEKPMATTIGALRGASLTDLELRDMSKQVVWLFPVAWRELTRLSFEGGRLAPAFSQLDAMTIMANCPKLVECTLHFAVQMDALSLTTNRGAKPLPNARVTLPDLKVLRISGDRPVVQGLPARLDLPSLEELSIDFSSSASTPDEVARSPHAEWINEHGGKLSSMTMDYISLTPATLVHCLERLPNVVNLKLLGLKLRDMYNYMQSVRIEPSPRGAAAVSDELLTRLTPKFDETGTEVIHPCLCPKLRRLECRMGSLERNEGALLKMVLARYGDGQKQMRGPVRRIEEVVLHYNRPRSVDIMKDLEGCGVDVFHLALKASYVKALDKEGKVEFDF